MRNFFTILFLLIIFSACSKKEEKIIIMPIDKINKQDNIKEYSDIFLNDENISTKNNKGESKLSLIIFGADGCSACAAMKNSLNEKDYISKFIEENYLPYYVNISRKENWNFNGRILNIKELKEKFMIVGTPTTVIMYGDNILLIYPGYITQKRMYGTLQFFLDKNLYSIDKNIIAERLKEYYKENHI